MTNTNEIKTLSPTDLFNKYSLKVSESDLNRLYSMNSALNGSKDEGHLQIQSVQELVKDSAIKMDILPANGKPSNAQALSFNDFQRKIDDKIVGFEAAAKRKASPEELRRILQEVEMDKVYRPRTFLSDKEVPTVSIGASDMADAYVMVGSEKVTVSKIPASQRALIYSALRPSVDQMISTFKTTQGRDPNASERKKIMDDVANRQPITEQKIAEYWVRGGRQR